MHQVIQNFRNGG